MIIITLLFSYLSWSQSLTNEQAIQLSTSKAWLKLVHYEKGLFGGQKSNADGKAFFLSEKGRKDPKLELLATVEAFQNTKGLNKDHPLCRFPARYLWLKKQINLPAVDFKLCTDWEEFREKINPEKAYVVFSSYFINTPASAFGHTLLRFKRKPVAGTQHSELLDYGVNYAAVVTTENALIYAIMGLSGGFKGVFTAIPYYYKIREYNDYESRDLFSYELNLNEEELNFMLAHMWELGQTYFDYYYLTQNCSYHILNLIEVARPELDLINKIPFYVIPVDTVKALYHYPDLVTKADYRPSLRSKLYNASKDFDKDHIENIKNLAEKNKTDYLVGKSNVDKAKEYDLAIDYYDYKHSGEVLFKATLPEQKRNLLLSRSELDVQGDQTDLKFPTHQFPHLSHPSQRMNYSFGTMEKSTYSSYEMRFALHDLLDQTVGEPPNLLIEFAKLRFNYFHQTHRFKLDNLTLFQVFNLSPITKFDTPFSWRANFGGKTIYDQSCADPQCFAFNTELAGGMAFNLDKREKFRLFTLIDGEINVGQFQKNHYRLGVGPLAGLYSELTPRLLLLNQVGYKYYFFIPELDNVYYQNEIRFTLSDRFAIGAQSLNQTSYDQYSGNLYWYY